MGIRKASHTYTFDITGAVVASEYIAEINKGINALGGNGDAIIIDHEYHQGLDQRETDYLTIYLRTKH